MKLRYKILLRLYDAGQDERINTVYICMMELDQKGLATIPFWSQNMHTTAI